MVTSVSDDFPPPYAKKSKVIRRSKKRRTMKRKDLEEMLSLVAKAAHVARDKGFHIVSPEAIQCVKTLRQLRTLPLTSRLITQTYAFSSLQFLSNNGNPKIRSEAKSVLDHWRQILQSKKE